MNRDDRGGFASVAPGDDLRAGAAAEPAAAATPPLGRLRRLARGLGRVGKVAVDSEEGVCVACEDLRREASAGRPRRTRSSVERHGWDMNKSLCRCVMPTTDWQIW